MSEDKFTKYPHMENFDEVPGIFELPEVVVTEKWNTNRSPVMAKYKVGKWVEHVLDQLCEAKIPIDLTALGEVMWKDVSPCITHPTKTLFANY